ncbi:MAG: alpha/beta fold hydrolase [Myxococcales bacterium]|nr:alpha/beta fold hydrolase [Myxococcales bacterium]
MHPLSPGVSFLLATLALLAATVAFLWAWVALSARVFRVRAFFDESYDVATEDGATIVLSRIRPRGEPRGLPPVVLCHGLAMNRRAFALHEKRSFAVAFAERGRDVWLLELRGSADAAPPTAIAKASFDDYATHDVPAALAFVREKTGANEVDWVGFSMGGMLAYAFLGARRGAGVRRLATIGSPVRFSEHPAARAFATFPLLLSPFLSLARTPFRWLALVAAPLVWPGVPRALSRGLRGEHYNGRWIRRMMANTLADVPSGVSKQFVRWLRAGTFDSNDGRFDYLDGLASITVPTFIVAGSHDRLAPPTAVLEAAERITAPVETLQVGARFGTRHDYDHLDLILGRDAVSDVFTPVAQWLDRRSL